MSEFKQGDFVQVEYMQLSMETESVKTFWRNAIYKGKDKSGSHMVCYGDGINHVLNNRIAIRKVEIKEP